MVLLQPLRLGAGRLCGTGCWRGQAHKCPKDSKICTLLLGTGQGWGWGCKQREHSTGGERESTARPGCADSTRGWRWESCAHTWLPADNALAPLLAAGCCAPAPPCPPDGVGQCWGCGGGLHLPPLSMNHSPGLRALPVHGAARRSRPLRICLDMITGGFVPCFVQEAGCSGLLAFGHSPLAD